MPISKRLPSISAFIALAVWPAAAQPILLHGAGSELSEAPSVITYAGSVKANLAAVEVSGQLAITVLADTIAEDQRDRVRSEILSFYQGAPSSSPAKKMILAVLEGQQLTQLGPFRSRMHLQTTLHKLWSDSAASQTPPPPADLYHWLVAAGPALGSNWNHVLLIGSLPELDDQLRDYASAWLANRLAGQPVRISYWNPKGIEPGWFAEVCRATGGIALSSDLTPLSDLLSEPKAAVEVSWPNPTPLRGFLLYRAKLVTAAGAGVGEFPAIASRPGSELPDLVRYAELRQHVETARKLQQEKPSQQTAAKLRSELEAALRINPSDPDALRVGADFYKKFNDWAAVAQLLGILTETQPANAALRAELGHAQFTAGQLPDAEKTLLQTRELGGGDARVAEELARIHIARQDDKGAQPFIEESLGKEAGNQSLWFLRADVAARLKDWSLQTASLERGIALGGETLERRTSLVRLYLDHQAGDKALPHVQAVTRALPKDAAVGRTYAEFFDELHRPDDALAVWNKVREIDPSLEIAHFRVTRLLFEKGSLLEALKSADAGLAISPKSARLIVSKSEILEKQGAFYESRDVLRKAASLDDPALLARLSELEDISGRAAARSYLHLAELLQKQSPQSPDYLRALARGQDVSWRDNDAETAAKFSVMLSAAGQKTPGANGPARRDASASAQVPGGLEALAFIAHARHPSSPDRFFLEFAKAVRTNTIAGEKPAKLYIESIQQHFQLVAALEALGVRDHEVVKLHLSLDDKKSLRQTEKILNLLGFKLRTNKNATTLDAGEKAAQAKRQETASALALDEAGMQEALEARKPFDLEFRDESALVLLGEGAWRTAFYAKENLPGGFAEAMSKDLRMAKLYAGLSVMDKSALTALLAGLELKTLADKYADLIYWYAPALALRKGHAAVPGGPAAEQIWAKAVGSSPSTPSTFFRALLEKDDGKLLSFYATLAQLDQAHQQFFTRNQVRTSKFYELYRQIAGSGRRRQRD